MSAFGCKADIVICALCSKIPRQGSLSTREGALEKVGLQLHSLRQAIPATARSSEVVPE
jgi:hypothetical protein